MELVVALSLMGILMMIATFDYRTLENDVQHSAQLMQGFLKKARAKALASTRSYTVAPLSSTRIVATYGNRCDDVQENDETLQLDLPSGAYLPNTEWSVCFTARGLSLDSADVAVTDGAITKTVQIVLGGGVRIL